MFAYGGSERDWNEEVAGFLSDTPEAQSLPAQHLSAQGIELLGQLVLQEIDA